MVGVVLLLVLCLLCESSLSKPAQPDPPTSGITTIGALKLATAEDCTGTMAFSAISGKNTDARLIFTETLINKGVGYVAETGIFTVHCPGLYQFSFAGYGSSDLKLTLKKKPNKSDNWQSIVSTGPAGGANLVLQDVSIGDQYSVFIDSGKTTEGTFTGIRVAKKS